ncbi:MAG: hypothetical protein EBX62_05850, partial [Betaproteobacteria bacterium]|nr:hypothetical protein [Betaproteobacteria bacterium]
MNRKRSVRDQPPERKIQINDRLRAKLIGHRVFNPYQSPRFRRFIASSGQPGWQAWPTSTGPANRLYRPLPCAQKLRGF